MKNSKCNVSKPNLIRNLNGRPQPPKNDLSQELRNYLQVILFPHHMTKRNTNIWTWTDAKLTSNDMQRPSLRRPPRKPDR